MTPGMRLRSGADGPKTRADAAKLWKEGGGERVLHFLPWLNLPRMVFEDEEEAVKAWLRAPYHDPWRLSDGCPQIRVPNLDIVGWFDHCNESIEFHQTMRRAGRTETARTGQRLIIGPWSHAGSGTFRRKVGNVDFGSEAEFDLVRAKIRWFDSWLQSKANGVHRDAPVRIFIMGANRWREEQEWPPKRKKHGMVPYTFRSRQYPVGRRTIGALCVKTRHRPLSLWPTRYGAHALGCHHDDGDSRSIAACSAAGYRSGRTSHQTTPHLQ